MSQLAREILKVASKSVNKAQKKSLENKIPNVYSKNGRVYFQLPDGAITQDTPKEYMQNLHVGSK